MNFFNIMLFHKICQESEWISCWLKIWRNKIEICFGGFTSLNLIQKPMVRNISHLSRSCQPFWASLGPLWIFKVMVSQLFSYKECLDQKTYLVKVDRSTQNPRGTHLSRPGRPFWGPLVAIISKVLLIWLFS